MLRSPSHFSFHDVNAGKICVIQLDISRVKQKILNSNMQEPSILNFKWKICVNFLFLFIFYFYLWPWINDIFLLERFLISLSFSMHHVAGLSFYTTEKGLLDAFSQYGQVVEGALWIL